MIQFNMVAGWMGFPRLTVSTGLTHSYAIAYRVTDRTNENWTARFTQFKNKKNRAEWGGATVLYDAVPDLIRHLGVDPKRTVFIPALSSGETIADENRSIPWITKESARVCGAQYIGTALKKNPHRKIHLIYSSDDRSAELDKANYQSEKLDADHVFIFDDIITRGDTLSRIAMSVLAVNAKCNVYGIALAKSERFDYCFNPENDHVPAKWDELWKQGERDHDVKFKKG